MMEDLGNTKAGDEWRFLFWIALVFGGVLMLLLCLEGWGVARAVKRLWRSMFAKQTT
jgi:hypothetical protein